MLRSHAFRTVLIASIYFATATIGFVQQTPQGAGRGGRGAAGQTVEKIRQLKPDLYLITGGGANTLVRVTKEGLITRASEAIKAGATRESLATQVKTDDLGWQFNPQFFGSLYDELIGKVEVSADRRSARTEPEHEQRRREKREA